MAQPLRVLIVDDSRDGADALALLVSVWGHETKTAYGGADALAALDHYPADVLIVDLVMPLLDGNELARRVRARAESGRMTLIALTGRHDRLALELFDHHLLKPAEPAVIESLLQLAALRRADDT